MQSILIQQLHKVNVLNVPQNIFKITINNIVYLFNINSLVWLLKLNYYSYACSTSVDSPDNVATSTSIATKGKRTRRTPNYLENYTD